ncbi:MAG: thioesterase [Candidatus Lokiarchaeota archaeon]|nr:thioesterase [Candidatus Lokiarchaeota archaeon]
MPRKLTHQRIDERYSGAVVELAEDSSKVELLTTWEMAVDGSGLVHGGFVFSLADHAAMVAINHPNVVLGAASVRFVLPIRAGEKIAAAARLARVDGKKRIVAVEVHRGGELVFEGEFTCFVPSKHVLGGAD